MFCYHQSPLLRHKILIINTCKNKNLPSVSNIAKVKIV